MRSCFLSVTLLYVFIGTSPDFSLEHASHVKLSPETRTSA